MKEEGSPTSRQIDPCERPWTGSAEFSPETPPMFRMQLDRWWGDSPRVLVCMANPSYAGADKNDPTIWSLDRLLRPIAGCGGFTVVNWEAYIATDPKDLYRWRSIISRDSIEDYRAIQSHNYRRIRRLSKTAFMRIIAWGDIVPLCLHRTQTLRAMSLDHSEALYCFGTTKSGAPKHPLARGKSRIPDGTLPSMWLGGVIPYPERDGKAPAPKGSAEGEARANTHKAEKACRDAVGFICNMDTVGSSAKPDAEGSITQDKT